MTSRRRLARGLVAALFALAGVGACSTGPPPAASDAHLGGSVVAKVGDEEIQSETVLRIAKAQGVAPRVALDRAIFDALVAQESRARRRELTGFESAGVLVQRLTTELRREAAAEGAPTSDELQPFIVRDWYDVARPRSARTVHVVVRIPDGADESRWEKATELATKLREAVLPAAELARSRPGPELVFRSNGDLEDDDPASALFVKDASAVPDQGFNVVVQPVPLVGEDGAAVFPRIEPSARGTFDPAYTKAVLELHERGDLSPPVRSSFGVHVILLLAWQPARHLDSAELHARYDANIIDSRARVLATALTTKLQTTVPVEIDRAADELLQAVEIPQ